DFSIDEEFLRYFHFVTEVCEWREGRLGTGEVAHLAERVYGPGAPKVAEKVDFLCRAFDTWVKVDIPAVFRDLFATAPAPIQAGDTGKVVLFGYQGSGEVDLCSDCCRGYGEMRGGNRVFSLPHAILLYAVLLHRLHETPDFPRRLRVLRNLIEASSNEVRLE